MKYERALLKFVLLFVLASQGNAVEIVKIRPKSSDKIYIGIYLTPGTLEIDHVENSEAMTMQSDVHNITTELNGHKGKVFYFTNADGLGVLDTASVNENGKVFVAYSSITARFSLNGSSQFYVGIRVSPGAIEICKMEDNDGNQIDISARDKGQELINNKPEFIYISKERLMRRCDEVTYTGDQSFTVRQSKIPSKFFIGDHCKDEYTGFVYTAESIEIFNKNHNAIKPMFTQIESELVQALANDTNIIIGNDGSAKQINKINTALNKEFIIVYYSNYSIVRSRQEVTFYVVAADTTVYKGHSKLDGYITVTEVLVGTFSANLMHERTILQNYINCAIVVNGDSTKKFLTDVYLMVDKSFTIKYKDG